MINFVSDQFLKDLDDTDWNGKTFTSGTDYFSKPIKIYKSNLLASLLAVRTSGTVTITFELSLTGKDGSWYTPSDVDGVSLGEIVSSLLATRWIVFTPQIGLWIRFKVVPNVTGVWSMQYIQQEGN